ncbi:hypothetical protein Tco_0701010 [Tanacetum coccineum]
MNMPYPLSELKGLEYTDTNIVDFEARLARIYRREVHKVQVFDFRGLPDLIAEGLSARMLMEHQDAQGGSLFTSRAWRRLFDIRGLLVELILEFFSTFRIVQAILDLDTPGALKFQLGGARRHMSWREFILALGLYTAEDMETVGFGAYWADRLTVITPELPIIDMAELVRLQICVEIDDTWAWVAMRPERQPDAAAGAPAVAKDAPTTDEGD